MLIKQWKDPQQVFEKKSQPKKTCELSLIALMLYRSQCVCALTAVIRVYQYVCIGVCVSIIKTWLLICNFSCFLFFIFLVSVANTALFLLYKLLLFQKVLLYIISLQYMCTYFSLMLLLLLLLLLQYSFCVCRSRIARYSVGFHKILNMS